jgi:hypothetical protein
LRRTIRTERRRYRAYGAGLPARIEDRHALIVASALMLVDLKRAGFRHGHGELSIPAGAVARPIHGPALFSCCGSPAALCADEDDEAGTDLHAPHIPKRTRPASED